MLMVHDKSRLLLAYTSTIPILEESLWNYLKRQLFCGAYPSCYKYSFLLLSSLAFWC